MYREDIWAFVDEEILPAQQKLDELVAYSEQTRDLPATIEHLNYLLQEVADHLYDLQHLYDRCIARFPTAEADGTPDPTLERLRGLISLFTNLLEGYHFPIK